MLTNMTDLLGWLEDTLTSLPVSGFQDCEQEGQTARGKEWANDQSEEAPSGQESLSWGLVFFSPGSFSEAAACRLSGEDVVPLQHLVSWML